MSEQPRQPLILSYAPSSRRRRWLRWVLRLTIVGFLVAACWRPAKAYAPVVQRDWMFYRALTYRAPATQIVFDNTARASSLLGTPGYTVSSTSAIRVCKPFEDLTGLFGPVLGSGATLPTPIFFMHERTGPDGARWLVVVTVLDQSSEGLVVFAMQRPAMLRRSQTLRFRADLDGDLIPLTAVPATAPTGVRVFAGQADPQDGSRFTIACERSGVTEIIEGKVLAGGQIQLATKSGGVRRSAASLWLSGTIQLRDGGLSTITLSQSSILTSVPGGGGTINFSGSINTGTLDTATVNTDLVGTGSVTIKSLEVTTAPAGK